MTLNLEKQNQDIDEELRTMHETIREIDDQIRKLKKEKSQNSGMK